MDSEQTLALAIETLVSDVIQLSRDFVYWSLSNRAIFYWLLCLAGIRLGMLFVLSFSPKPEVGKTLTEVPALPVSINLKLTLVTLSAAAACYFFDVSKVLSVPFVAIPEVFLLPAGFLYALSIVVVGIVIAVGTAELHYYMQLAVEKSRKWFYLSMAMHALRWLMHVALLTVYLHVHFLSEYIDFSDALSDDPLWIQYLYLNPGFLPLLAFAVAAYLVHNHHKTLLAEKVTKKKIQTACTVLIAYITVSLIALEVLSVTAALVGLALAACNEWVNMKSLRKRISKPN